jgi:type VI secretion system secreted protein Hcp
MQYCATGKHLNKATLTAIRSAGNTLAKYLEVVLTDVIVSSYHTVVGHEQEFPQDVISLNFARIDQEYFSVDNNGATTSAAKGSWNQQTGGTN